MSARFSRRSEMEVTTTIAFAVFLLFGIISGICVAQVEASPSEEEISRLLNDDCAQCHDLNRVILVTEAWAMGDWMHAFDEMAKRRPELSEAQMVGIAQYLDARREELKLEPSAKPAQPEGMTEDAYNMLYESRCITCHDTKMLERVPESFSREDWGHVVERMMKKSPQFLAGIDREKVVDYLYKFKTAPEEVREKPAEAKALTENIYYKIHGSIDVIAEDRDTYTFNDDTDSSDIGFKRKEGFAEIVAFVSVDVFDADAKWAARVSAAVDYLNDRGNDALDSSFNGQSNDTYIDVSFEEAWLEAKLFDTPNRLRVGLQEYKSDFLGLIYNDNDLGVRLYGENEKLKWNLSYFYKTEHDAVSELFDPTYADQDVFIATLQFDVGTVSVIPSVHYNRDRRDDRELDVAYLGLAHYGMVGPFATTSAFYYAFGDDDNSVMNPARDQDISAFHIVADAGYPIGKFTPHVGVFYTSGDDDPTDGDARGFDSIYDTISVWGDNGIIIDDRINAGTLTVLRNNSAIPSLRDFDESANFINPGVLAFNFGLVTDWTDKFATDMNLTYFEWDETDVLGPGIGEHVGWEANVSGTYKWADYLNLTLAAAALITDDDMEDIYGDDENLYNLYLKVSYSF